MKLNARDASGYFSRPDPKKTGVLIYGADAMRVAIKRQDLIAALIGPQGSEEMRLNRLAGSDLRKDPAALSDAVKAVGFFPGPRVAFVDSANDQAAPAILSALEDWQEGDAQIIVTAGALRPTSKIRKAFENHSNAYAVGIYDEPMSRGEIEETLRKSGVASLDRDAANALDALSRAIDPGDFRQTVEKLALYKYGNTDPVTIEDIEAVAPVSTEAALDDVLNIVAEARTADIGPVLRRLQSQGVLPVTMCIGAMRHFRTLHAVCSDPGGPGQGIGKLRPPVFGPRRDRVLRQAQNWGLMRLEQAVEVLTDTDLQLRSTAKAPQAAVMERALIRLSMLGRQR
jgi:DNA polymerase-3 subunit delta